MSDAMPESPVFVPPGRLQLALRRIGRRLREWAYLTRMHRPVGIWLLLWPTLWGVWVAADGKPSPRLFAIFLLGTVAMRAAGCVINDLADRDIDPHVRRTRDRPLAARRVSPFEAWALFLAFVSVALWLALQLNSLALRLSFIGAALTISYPLLKRFFPAPQFYLGLAFGWGVPMAFAATLDEIPRHGWLLFIAALLWAVVYDTEYAMVDREDDRRIGVRSTAVLFGDLDKLMIGVMQVLMIIALLLVARRLGFGIWYYLGLGALAICFLRQQWLIRGRAPELCFKAFVENRYAGLMVFIGIVLDYIFR
jgi:4-hydroxybenzoate polyprenyltransferase